jgi:hypothetical protein
VSAGRHGVANEGVGSGPAVGQNPGRDVLTTWARVALRTVDRQHQRERSNGAPAASDCNAPYNRLQRCYERREEVIDAFFYLSR